MRLSALSKLPVPVLDPTFVVVGIVRDASNQGPRELPMPQVFVPFTFRARGLNLVLRTAAEPARFGGALKREFQSLDSRVALIEPTPLETVLDQVLLARPRFSLLMLGIFACAGILLVAMGVTACSPTPCRSKRVKSRFASRSAATAATSSGWC